MKKIIIPYLLLVLVSCKSTSQPKSTTIPIIDFNLWHSVVMDTFESKTNFSKGSKREFGTSLGIVHTSIQQFSEDKIQALFKVSSAGRKDWDRMFIVRQFVEGETSISITSMLFYKKSKYRGLSYDGQKYYKVKKIPEFKIWTIKADSEFGNNNYLIISEFDKTYKNINNSVLIGMPNYEFENKILKIYDNAIFD